MIVTKRALARRTVLRGMGVAVALPLLEAMVPALTALAQTPARPTLRLGIVYLPNGVVIDKWTPSVTGASFELSPILKPLQPFQDRLVVVSGLNLNAFDKPYGGAVHGRAATKFLTGTVPRPVGEEGNDFHADISIDQLVAKQLGEHTQLASLELSLDSGDVGAGTCDNGYSCTYAHTISWRGPATPLPMEHNPRAVFERMFGDDGTTDGGARLARMQRNRSLLDSVADKVAGLRARLGPDDGARLAEYLDAIRDVERRIQRAEEQSTRDLPRFDQPPGVPSTFQQHARLMFDLQVLAYQTDLTRVITFMIGREFTGRTYPEIGAPGAHHPLSHESSAASQEQLVRINTYHASQLAYYLQRLRDTSDGDGSLLDHTIVYYGAGMSDGLHSPVNLPIVLAGGTAAAINGGHHRRFPSDTPLANLHLAVLHRLGMPLERIHDSTAPLDLSPEPRPV